jgi:hypothetical protein
VQQVAWRVRKPAEGAPAGDVQAEAAGACAEPGQKPAGAVRRAIDLANGTVTLKGPQGNGETIKARKPDHLKKLKVGDLVDILHRGGRDQGGRSGEPKVGARLSFKGDPRIDQCANGLP